MTTLIHQSNSFNNLLPSKYFQHRKDKMPFSQELHTTYKGFRPGERLIQRHAEKRMEKKD